MSRMSWGSIANMDRLLTHLVYPETMPAELPNSVPAGNTAALLSAHTPNPATSHYDDDVTATTTTSSGSRSLSPSCFTASVLPVPTLCDWPPATTSTPTRHSTTLSPEELCFLLTLESVTRLLRLGQRSSNADIHALGHDAYAKLQYVIIWNIRQNDDVINSSCFYCRSIAFFICRCAARTFQHLSVNEHILVPAGQCASQCVRDAARRAAR